MGKLYVLSLGGSLIVPDEIDQDFLNNFRKLILSQIKRGHRFIIITGGGQTSRRYQTALKKASRATSAELDWMGIEATLVNARLVQLMFGKIAHQKIISDPNKKVNFKEKILVAGGWKPGRSSDDCAVRLAHTYGSNTVINLSNIDYVYDKDPRKYKNARKLPLLSWRDYNRMFDNRWNPGAHVPFDPVAARFAQKHGQKVIIAHGRDLKNLHKILQNVKFKGTEVR
jgi:uridylate kinase